MVRGLSGQLLANFGFAPQDALGGVSRVAHQRDLPLERPRGDLVADQYHRSNAQHVAARRRTDVAQRRPRRSRAFRRTLSYRRRRPLLAADPGCRKSQHDHVGAPTARSGRDRLLARVAAGLRRRRRDVPNRARRRRRGHRGCGRGRVGRVDAVRGHERRGRARLHRRRKFLGNGRNRSPRSSGDHRTRALHRLRLRFDALGFDVHRRGVSVNRRRAHVDAPIHRSHIRRAGPPLQAPGVPRAGGLSNGDRTPILVSRRLRRLVHFFGQRIDVDLDRDLVRIRHGSRSLTRLRS